VAIIRARDVALAALSKCGVIPPGQRSARDKDLAIALQWLSIFVGHLAATRRLAWLERTWTVPLLAGISSYNLRDVTQIPDSVNDGRLISDWLECYRVWGTNRDPMRLLREDEWRSRDLVEQHGTPDAVWIERLETPILHVLGTPAVDGYSLRVTGSIDPAELATNAGAVPIEVPQGWLLTLALHTAVLISDGAVVRLDQGRRDTMKREANGALDEIEVRSDREHLTVEFVEPWGY
jgi:hypothetical protein